MSISVHSRCYSLFYRVTSSSTTHFLQSGMFMRTFFLSLSLHGPLRLAKLQCRPAAVRASGGLGRGRARATGRYVTANHMDH